MAVINAWLDLPVIGVFAVLVIVYGLTGTIIAWLTFRSPLSSRIHTCGGVSPSFFAAVSVLFALLTGFLAGDVIDRNKQAVRAVQIESGALAALNALTVASSADMAPIRVALHAYLETLVHDEWKREDTTQPSAKAEASLGELLRLVADPKITPLAGQEVHNALINLTLRAAAARSDRLALSAYQSDGVKWATLLFLCLMTQVAIGAVHLERPRAHVAALTIFTIAAIVSLGLIAIQEDPFDGAVRASPTPLERVLKAVTP
jgi:hypothetical protein